jgi:hypothetical protein
VAYERFVGVLQDAANVAEVAPSTAAYYANVGEIWMLTIYAKNVEENIPANVLRQIREEIDG